MSKISILENKINDITKAGTLLRDEISRIHAQSSAASVYIDFDRMRVFSIERMVRDDIPCTVIGHLVKECFITRGGKIVTNDKIREWNLYCSADRHEELVQQFTEWKKQNGSTKTNHR